METMKASSNVFIRLPSTQLRLFRLSPGSTINLGKFGSFHAKHLIGCPYGQSYEILPNHEIRLTQPDRVPPDMVEEELRNNRGILDDPKTQTLSPEEIQALKKDASLTGDDIISQVINAHSTFAQKTTFSQEKYTKRKQGKFSRNFTVLRPDIACLTEFVHEKEAYRTMNMSVETLSLLLSLANIRAAGRYLVLEDTNGLVTSGLLERMGCEGEIMFLHEGEHPHYTYTDILNIEGSTFGTTVKSLNLLQAFSPEEELVPPNLGEEELKIMPSAKAESHRRRYKRYVETKEKMDLYQQGDFDALILATSFDVPALLPQLLPKIAPSGSLVVYSQFREELLPVHNYLTSAAQKRVICLDIHEIRLREYQTLVGRMHPKMTSKGWGGYLLSGIVVAPVDVEPIGNKPRRRKREASEDAKLKMAKLDGNASPSLDKHEKPHDDEMADV